MADIRYVRLALGESAQAEIKVVEQQAAAVDKAIAAAVTASQPTVDLDLLKLRAANEVDLAKLKASLVKLPEVTVRVITMHPDDRDANKIANRIDNVSEFYDNQMDAFTGRPVPAEQGGKLDPPTMSKLSSKEVLEASDRIAEVKCELDMLRLDLLRVVLKDNHSGKQIEDMIATCTHAEISAVLKVARWPELLPSVSPLQSVTPPTNDSMPT